MELLFKEEKHLGVLIWDLPSLFFFFCEEEKKYPRVGFGKVGSEPLQPAAINEGILGAKPSL